MILTDDQIVVMQQLFRLQFLERPQMPSTWPDTQNKQHENKQRQRAPREDKPGGGEETPHGYAGQRPPFTPGPIPASEGSLGQRRMQDPVARVLVGCYWARICLMPCMHAANAAERDALNVALAQITGVADLIRDGRALRCVVTWTRGRWPKFPTQIRVSLPGGEDERRRLLGALETHARRFTDALLAPGEMLDGPRRSRPGR